jgi:hypothetical protein
LKLAGAIARLKVVVIKEFVATPVPVGLTDSIAGGAVAVEKLQEYALAKAAPVPSVTAVVTVAVYVVDGNSAAEGVRVAVDPLADTPAATSVLEPAARRYSELAVTLEAASARSNDTVTAAESGTALPEGLVEVTTGPVDSSAWIAAVLSTRS